MKYYTEAKTMEARFEENSKIKIDIFKRHTNFAGEKILILKLTSEKQSEKIQIVFKNPEDIDKLTEALQKEKDYLIEGPEYTIKCLQDEVIKLRAEMDELHRRL